ncbi:peptidase family M13 [Oesophagostomum dentatum]|uniref:Peptidase family M13 n=1 Tax=Oesophagostomum dentatum TaxID=61180 RepID=A0A0B1T6M5_OESDE|nr:peptidase family M13 [Oesophagostomum dentatum]
MGGLPKVCNSKDCIEIAFRFTNNIDDSVDPCNNFYRYSCGKFHRQDLDRQMNFLETQTDSTRRALYALLSTTDSNDTSRTAQLSRSLFGSCMDNFRRSNAGYSPLIERLKNLPCGPLLSGCNFDSASYSWERHSGMLGWYAGTFNLVNFGTDVHPQDRTQITLQFIPPDLSEILDPVREQLIELAHPGPTEIDTLLQVQLRQNLTKSVLFEYIQPDEKQRQNALEEVSQLMVDVNKIATTTPSNVTDITFGELKQAVPNIAWNDLLYAELSTMIKLSDSTMISVVNLAYFEQLSQLVAKSSPQALANYLVAVTAKQLEQFVYDEKIQPTWNRCIENMESLEPVEKLYILSHPNYQFDKIKSYLKEVKQSFILAHQATLLRHLGEINRIAFLVGYPKRLTDESLVTKPFASVPIDPNDYFTSITGLLKQQSTYRLSQIGTYLDADDTTDELLRTTELADALKTTSNSYSKWDQGSSTHTERNLPGFDNYDDVQNMMMVFGTLFCNREGAQPGSPYEAMINTAASNLRLFSTHFKCPSGSALYNRKSCL